MPTFGYLAYLIRVAPPHRTRALQRLSAIGHQKVDLLDAVRDRLNTIGHGYHPDPVKAEGFRMRETKSFGRSQLVMMRKGPHGIAGETYDIETGGSTETGEGQAQLSELRAAFYIPEDSYFGFMFVERIGGRHLKDLLYKNVIVPIAKEYGVGIRIESFAETDAWRQELAGQQVLRVTELFFHQGSEEDSSTVDDTLVKVTTEGGALHSASERIKDSIFDLLDRRHEEYRRLAAIAPLEERRKVWRPVKKRDGTEKERWTSPPKGLFTVEDQKVYEELLAELDALKNGSADEMLVAELRAAIPVDRSDLESRRLEVGLGQERPERTFVVESDSVPQLVYEMKDRPVDVLLQRTWEAHAESLLVDLGVALPPGWLLAGATQN